VGLLDEIRAEEFSNFDASKYPAVLVRKDGAPGSVVVHGPGTDKNKPHVITGQDSGAVILFLRKGQSCIVYGNPSIRLFALESHEE